MNSLIQVLLIICIMLSFPFKGNSAFPQKSNFLETSENVRNCINVSLIASSFDIEVKEGSLVSVVVKIENISKKKIELVNTPIFDLERIGIIESDKNKLIWGNYYSGKSNSKKQKTLEKKILDPGETVEFLLEITELIWKDSMSSVDVWRKMFVFMEKGDYFLKAQVLVKFSNDEDEEQIENFPSNKIKLSYK